MYRIVLCRNSRVQCSTVQYNTVQFSVEQCSAVEYRAVHCHYQPYNLNITDAPCSLSKHPGKQLCFSDSYSSYNTHSSTLMFSYFTYVWNNTARPAGLVWSGLVWKGQDWMSQTAWSQSLITVCGGYILRIYAVDCILHTYVAVLSQVLFFYLHCSWGLPWGRLDKEKMLWKEIYIVINNLAPPQLFFFVLFYYSLPPTILGEPPSVSGARRAAMASSTRPYGLLKRPGAQPPGGHPVALYHWLINSEMDDGTTSVVSLKVPCMCCSFSKQIPVYLTLISTHYK